MQRTFIIIPGIVIIGALIYLFFLNNGEPDCPSDARIEKMLPGELEAGNTGTFSLAVLEGNPPQSIDWFVDDIQMYVEEPNPSIFEYEFPSSADEKVYTLKAIVNQNCVFKQQFDVLPDEIEAAPALAEVRFQSPRTIRAGTVFNFSDKSISDGNITSWEWDFGDGNRSEKQNPQHRYSKEGTYTVTLTLNGNSEFFYSKKVAVLPRKNSTPVVRKKTYEPPANLETILLINLKKIASEKTTDAEKTQAYDKIKQYVADENIPVEINEGGAPRKEDLHSYYYELSIEGGQNILEVKVSMDSQRKVSTMRVKQKVDYD